MADDLLLSFIVKNNHPFTIVEELDFRLFIHALNPDYKLIQSATTIKSRISAAYIQKKKEIIQLLRQKGNSKFSATTDIRTSGNDITTMSVTVSWIDKEFEMHEIVLGFRRVVGNCGDNFASVFLSVLREYDIEEKVM